MRRILFPLVVSAPGSAGELTALYCGRPSLKIVTLFIFAAMSTAIKSIKRNNCLRTLSIQIYTIIARLPCDSMAFFLVCFGHVR